MPSVSLNSNNLVRIMSGLNMCCVSFLQGLQSDLAKISLVINRDEIKA